MNISGNQVVICGRRQDKLDEASTYLPGVKTIQADIATPEGRSVFTAGVVGKRSRGNLNTFIYRF